MDNIQPSNAVSFQGIDRLPQRQVQQTETTTKPTQKKDGTKLMFASLAALAAIGGGVYLLKSGKGKQALDGVKKALGKNNDVASNVPSLNLANKTSQEINALDSAIKTGTKKLQGDLQQQRTVLAGLEEQLKKLGDNPPEDKVSELVGKIEKQKTKISKIENSIAKNENSLREIHKEVAKRPTLSYSANGTTVKSYLVDSDNLIISDRNKKAAAQILEGNKTQIDELTSKISSLGENSAEAIPLKTQLETLKKQSEKIQKGLSDTQVGNKSTLQQALNEVDVNKAKNNYQIGINKATEKIKALTESKDAITEQINKMTGNLSADELKLKAELLKQQADIEQKISVFKNGIQELQKKL